VAHVNKHVLQLTQQCHQACAAPHLGPLKLDSVQRALEETLLLHAASFTNVLIFCMALC